MAMNQPISCRALTVSIGAVTVAAALTLASAASAAESASQGSTQKPTATSGNAAPGLPTGVPTPPDYVIGADDILSIVIWREKDLSGDVVVRPDGRISLPLLNDVDAAGMTPEELRVRLTQAAEKLIEDPNVTVIVKEINSRKVFVTGQISKPGPYPLTTPSTVLQMIATAGGLLEYADEKNIRIMRTEKGKPVSFKFNYKDVSQGKKLEQNIELKPGDTIIVP